MHKIISFFTRYKIFLLFIILEIIAFSLTIQSHSYHKSKYINSSNFVTGIIYDKFNIIGSHLHLKKQNAQLAKENNKLKNLLINKQESKANKVFNRTDSLVYNQKITFINAIVKNNTYHKSNNRLTLNKGKKDSITSGLAVVNSQGVVGIVSNVSNNYATVMSIINENTKINARLKNNSDYGTISWNGLNHKTVQFDDLPRQANIKIGDTIITGGKSTIFPEGILIGKVKDFKLNNKNYQIINVSLFNDMSAIRHVNIVTNLDKLEIKTLENNNE